MSVSEVKAEATDIVVELDKISKSFGGVRVLDSVDLTLLAGRVHGLVGMNGSGKSTLIKILAGVHKPDPGGSLRLVGASDATPSRSGAVLRRASSEVRIGFVHQDLALIDTFSIVDNFALSLGYEMSRLGRARRKEVTELTAQGLARVSVQASPLTDVGDLGAADRSLVAIARALTQLAGAARPCFVLDEPTAALPRREVDRVLGTVRQLAGEGAAVLFVSHNMGEVSSVTDDITVLRDGRAVLSAPTKQLTTSDIVDQMLGESTEKVMDIQHGASGRHANELADARVPVVRVDELTGERIDGLDLTIQPGEIVALTGLVGCGKSEAGRILAGSSAALSGRIEVDGVAYTPSHPSDAIQAGVSYVPAERLVRGGILSFSAAENISLPVLRSFWRRGLIDGGRERSVAGGLMRSTRAYPDDSRALFGTFSGGNQQKLVFSRALVNQPRLLIVDEPTQGVDVGAIPVLYDCIRVAAEAGTAVLLISSSYEEVVELAHRAIVLDRGRVCSRLGADQLTVPNLVAAAASPSEDGHGVGTTIRQVTSAEVRR